AERFVIEFEDLTKDIHKNLNVIIDITEAILLRIESIDIILDLLKRNNEKLNKSAFIISKNPPLGVEFKYLLEHAESPKRKIVSNLEDAKEWIGIGDIIIKKD
ncbi:unnamed protein product, partial [marine sediment metagenome]